ncbi:hypothetical protein BDV39DRAFT_210845 [Aspergillus sergii]|uniref:Uncharacterized protein n=1 Tax=Aspergillus sergii TaxID=1034303 RepID=A0A5N6WKL2_9EURO|nr:hypothetical protein BDV39DRAFT_210845 [Aspergillus sergii]
MLRWMFDLSSTVHVQPQVHQQIQPQPIVPLVDYDTDNDDSDNILYLIPEHKHTEPECQSDGTQVFSPRRVLLLILSRLIPASVPRFPSVDHDSFPPTSRPVTATAAIDFTTAAVYTSTIAYCDSTTACTVTTTRRPQHNAPTTNQNPEPGIYTRIAQRVPILKRFVLLHFIGELPYNPEQP